MTSLRHILLVAMVALAPSSSQAAPVNCGVPDLIVDAEDGALAASICEVASGLIEPLAACDVVPPAGLLIEIASDLPEHCAGLYDCDRGVVRIRSPQDAHAMLTAEDAFAILSADAYFRGLLAHELTHAAFFDSPRGCGTCRATTEYASHVTQLLVLSDEDREAVIARLPETRWADRDSINVMILALAPGVFHSRAWSHATQVGDPCEAVRRVMDGTQTFPEELR